MRCGEDGLPALHLPGDYYISAEAVVITSEEDVNKFIESRRILEKITDYNYPNSSVYGFGITERVI